MKLLSGTDIAGFIKERQSRQVDGLVGRGVQPKLAIVQVKDDPVINTYVKLKKRYGAEVGIAVDIHVIKQVEVKDLLAKLNKDNSVHGIIVQLPLEDTTETDQILNLVAADKDVDGLAKNTQFDPATPTAILWLLGGHNVELKGKVVVIIGQGPLVGTPLIKMLEASGISVIAADRQDDLATVTKRAEVIITATGQAGLITSKLVPPNAIVVDAGVAAEKGKTVGDVAPEVYERDDLTITPSKGGVGPLTVCSLFENVIKSASAKSNE